MFARDPGHLRGPIPGLYSVAKIEMAIDRHIFYGTQRKSVAWFEVPPPADGAKAFTERGFAVESQPLAASDLNDLSRLGPLAAVVFTQDAANLKHAAQAIGVHARHLLDYDCRIVVRVCDQPSIDNQAWGFLANVVDKLRLWNAGFPKDYSERFKKWHLGGLREPALPHIRFYGNNAGWPEIANFLLEHQPGRPPNDNLKILPEDERQRLIQKGSGYEILLKRAFWDCTEVHLKPLDAGRSRVFVYCAYADLGEGHFGRWPLPYFLKIGERGKIFDEYENYEDRVDPYIPFHLGPHLIRERCCLGATSGVIVGDYVEESESLFDCACEGRAAAAIACLFDRTLVGWHRIAKRKDEYTLAQGFREQFPKTRDDLGARLSRARELGASLDLTQLRGLFEQCTSTPVLIGPIHWDLHAANVRVRTPDAIVIDFLAHKEGPLLYDAALLEASLLVEGFPDCANCSGDTQLVHHDITGWLQSIENLYEDVSLNGVLDHPNPKSSSCWFHSCVRQIRRYARDMQTGPNQYAACLALALLKKATKDLNISEPEASRRAAAYVLAERILMKAFNRNPEVAQK
jgi:hypothetical protein